MRIIVEHLRNVGSALREHARVAGIASHGDNIGRAREGVVDHFLSQNLPQTLDFVTGEIFDADDERSGQIDLIIYPKSSPKLNLHGDVNLVLSDAVVAAIEVKSNLTTASLSQSSHLKAALNSCARVKQLRRIHQISGITKDHKVVLPNIPYLIFAYEGPTVSTLEEKIYEYQIENNLSIDLMPDMVTVLSRDYYLVRNNGWHISRVPNPRVFYSSISQPEATMTGMFSYLTKLSEAVWQYPRPTPFSEYLRNIEPGAQKDVDPNA